MKKKKVVSLPVLFLSYKLIRLGFDYEQLLALKGDLPTVDEQNTRISFQRLPIFLRSAAYETLSSRSRPLQFLGLTKKKEINNKKKK